MRARGHEDESEGICVTERGQWRGRGRGRHGNDGDDADVQRREDQDSSDGIMEREQW